MNSNRNSLSLTRTLLPTGNSATFGPFLAPIPSYPSKRELGSDEPGEIAQRGAQDDRILEQVVVTAKHRLLLHPMTRSPDSSRTLSPETPCSVKARTLTLIH